MAEVSDVLDQLVDAISDGQITADEITKPMIRGLRRARRQQGDEPLVEVDPAVAALIHAAWDYADNGPDTDLLPELIVPILVAFDVPENRAQLIRLLILEFI